MENKKLTIGHLFPDLLNLYGDKGNILTLKNRLLWRGMEAEIRTFEKDDILDFQDLDILFLGGGSHREQLWVLKRLKTVVAALSDFVESDGVFLAVCGGFQMLGKTYKTLTETVEGLSILDIKTEEKEDRFIGNVVLSSEVSGEEMTIVGFENHGGRTDIGSHIPLGRVICGQGNNGKDGTCGVVYKNLIGTYLHGPLLPKNPKLADELLKRAFRRKYGTDIFLAPLDDSLENEAHQYVVNRFTKV